MKLIDKDALVVEIDNVLGYVDEHWDTDYAIGAKRFADILQDAIDTLEVKEVDLEKELDYDDYVNFFNEHPDYSDRDWGFDECWVFAKHFFELGLKAQKGE